MIRPLFLLVILVALGVPAASSPAAGSPPERLTVSASAKTVPARPNTAKAGKGQRKASPRPSLRAQLRAANARAEHAEAQALTASQANAALKAHYDRSSILKMVLVGMLTVAVIAAVLIWRVRGDRIERLEQDLDKARAQADRLPETDARLARASTELSENLARMGANRHTIMRQTARIEALEAENLNRAIVSGEQQLTTLDKAASRGEVVVSCPVLNGEERNIARYAKAWAQERGLVLHPQVAMRGFLEPQGVHVEAVRKTFNSKRCDMVLFDGQDRVVLVIEHHGSGHEQDDWEIRDKVKRRVLNLARVGLVVTKEHDDESRVRARLDAAWAAPAAAIPPWLETKPSPRLRGSSRRWSRRA